MIMIMIIWLNGVLLKPNGIDEIVYAIIQDAVRSSFLCQVQEVRYVYVGMQSCQRGY